MSLAPASLEGRKVGPYRVLRRIGVGGMAEIYLAEVGGHGAFRKEVALKVLHPHYQTQPAVVEMFEAEACITASLHHPNIVDVFAFEADAGRIFMVCEYVRGLDLKTILARLAARQERLDPDLALAIALEIARALRYAHGDLPEATADRPPVLHRDLGPDNVMVADSGVVKLLDFGVAKTLVGSEDIDPIARGKWAYMSPEQVRGEPLDGRSDLFGLGALFYEMLTGTRAFAGATQVDTMRRVEQADVPPAPGVDPLLESLLERLLARDREDRFPNASAAVVAFRQVQMHRAGLREQPELAELVRRLEEPVGARRERPTVALRGGRPEVERGTGIGDVTGQVTVPAAGGFRRSQLAGGSPDEGESVEVTDPFGGDKTTLPPGGHPSAPVPAAAPAPWEPTREVDSGGALPGRWQDAPGGESDPEDLETTAARPSAEAVLRGPEGAGAEGLVAAGPSLATEDPVPPPGNGPPRPGAPGPEHPSVPGVYFEHFLPEVALSGESDEPVEAAPRWSRKNILTLILALLAIGIAAAAIVLAVQQRRPAGPGVASSRADGVHRRPRADAAAPVVRPMGTSATRVRGALTSRPPAHRESGAAPASGGPERATVPASPGSGDRTEDLRPARQPPARRPEASPPEGLPEPVPKGRRPRGLPRTGQLDVVTRPRGAVVLVRGRPVGRTPLRLQARPGRPVRLMVSLPGYRLYKSPVWMPLRLGRRLSLILPPVRPRPRHARAGQTAIAVRCSPGHYNRVYLDGRDTGLDCPTPPLAVLPTVHTVSVYLPRRHRVLWKTVRPRPGQTVRVSFPE